MKRLPLAFSLIELLTALAVIGALAAILIPVVGNAIAAARTNQAAANIRELALGIRLYANEHQLTTPKLWRDYNEAEIEAGMQKSWREAVLPYLGYTEDDMTPIHEPAGSVFYSPNAEPQLDGRLTAHFGLNANIFEPEWAYRLDRVDEPSGIILLGEINRWTETCNPRHEPVYTGDENTFYRISNPGHKGAYAFVDGHVELIAGNIGTNAANPNAEEDAKRWRWW